MSLESLIAMLVLMLAAVAGSSLFVRLSSSRDREIHLREEAAHEAARRRRLQPTGSLAPEAGSFLPARPVPPPMTTSPRHGGARLRFRYAALVLLAVALPTSSGPITPERQSAAPTEECARTDRVILEVKPRPSHRIRCDRTILASVQAGDAAPRRPGLESPAV